ncbi:MAG: polysaccharide deacetylase family protein [Blastocatellia bacterium]|nr:polysaccharide deacetylase family protein [Blastocatellia bacterium]
MKRSILITIVIASSTFATGQTLMTVANAQAEVETLAERLGYSPRAKLLIVHADDLGMARSVNAASIKAFETGLVNSGSIMVPCPWFPEIASYARSHPEADLGLHLTLTSEWTSYRWGPVLSKGNAASLLDREGYFHLTETEAAKHMDAREAEAEIRAQIERARAFGIRPTHLDSHMGTLYQNRTLLETLLRVARDYKLPVRLSREWFTRIPYLPSMLEPNDICIDHVISIGPDVPPEGWGAFYADAIKSIRPGVTEMIIHLAYDDEEMRAATVNHPDWGAGWRQRDFDFFTNDSLRRLLKENDIKLITWREIGKLAASGQN